MKKDTLQKSFDYKAFSDKLFELYSQNSFGSFPKKELDVFLFDQFKEMGKIQSDSSWDLAKELKITKSKAQTLFYESVIRYHAQSDVKKIQNALDKIPQSLDKGIFSLIIDDRYARESMRDYLAKSGYVTDLSFASDVVKVPVDAYWILLERYNPSAIKSLEKDQLIMDLKSLGKEAFSGIISKFTGEPVGHAVEKTLYSFFRFVQKSKRDLPNKVDK